MKSTDIPNGYVVAGMSKGNILVDFDENGKAEKTATEVDISGWPEGLIISGRICPDILVLVHSVKGENQILLKRLGAVRLDFKGKQINVAEVAKMGMLNGMAERIRKQYLEEKERMEKESK